MRPSALLRRLWRAAPVSPHGLRVTLTFPARQESPEYAAAGVSAEA